MAEKVFHRTAHKCRGDVLQLMKQTQDYLWWFTR